MPGVTTMLWKPDYFKLLVSISHLVSLIFEIGIEFNLNLKISCYVLGGRGGVDSLKLKDHLNKF